CLYCGAGRRAGAGAEGPAQTADLERGAPAAPEPSRPAAARVLQILELEGADPQAVGRLLALSAFEAGQRCRRGGFELVRLAPAEGAERWAAGGGAPGPPLFPMPEGAGPRSPRL